MLNRSASLAMSTSVLKALPGKLDIKRHSPSILYLPALIEKSAKNLNLSVRFCIYMDASWRIWSMHSKETIARDAAHINDLNLNIPTRVFDVQR